MTKRLGIIGAGKVGTTLGRLALAAGWEVRIAASGRQPLQDLIVETMLPGARLLPEAAVVADSDVIVLAVPLSKVRELDLDALSDKVVVDAMNHWYPVDGNLDGLTEGGSSSDWVAALNPRMRLVKSLNHLGYHDMETDARPVGHAERRGVAVGNRCRRGGRPAGRQQEQRRAPVAAAGGGAYFFGVIAQLQKQRKRLLRDGLHAIKRHIAHGDAQFSCGFDLDSIISRCKKADKAQLRQFLHDFAAYNIAVQDDSFGVLCALYDFFGLSGVIHGDAAERPERRPRDVAGVCRAAVQNNDMHSEVLSVFIFYPTCKNVLWLFLTAVSDRRLKKLDRASYG